MLKSCICDVPTCLLHSDDKIRQILNIVPVSKQRVTQTLWGMDVAFHTFHTSETDGSEKWRK
jgi:hypothetical protein